MGTVAGRSASAVREIWPGRHASMGPLACLNPACLPDNESKVIWGVVAAALVFGGGLDDETAKKIGEAQRGFYPKPPGLDEAYKLKAAKAAASAGTAPSAFP